MWGVCACVTQADSYDSLAIDGTSGGASGGGGAEGIASDTVGAYTVLLADDAGGIPGAAVGGDLYSPLATGPSGNSYDLAESDVVPTEGVAAAPVALGASAALGVPPATAATGAVVCAWHMTRVCGVGARASVHTQGGCWVCFGQHWLRSMSLGQARNPPVTCVSSGGVLCPSRNLRFLVLRRPPAPPKPLERRQRRPVTSAGC